MNDLINYEKLTPAMVLEHCIVSLSKGERSQAKVELMSRCLANVPAAYREKVAFNVEALLVALVEARKRNALTERVALEKEILIQMTRPAAPAPSAVPPPPPPPALAQDAPTAPAPPRPDMGLFDLKQMHDFFLSSAEHHERAALEMGQYAALCRRMCERIRPDLYDTKSKKQE